jgi:hypothetical protein
MFKHRFAGLPRARRCLAGGRPVATLPHHWLGWSYNHLERCGLWECVAVCHRHHGQVHELARTLSRGYTTRALPLCTFLVVVWARFLTFLAVDYCE